MRLGGQFPRWVDENKSEPCNLREFGLVRMNDESGWCIRWKGLGQVTKWFGFVKGGGDVLPGSNSGGIREVRKVFYTMGSQKVAEVDFGPGFHVGDQQKGLEEACATGVVLS